jgi:16S rRNA (guanine966-N2)-methyltransferase
MRIVGGRFRGRVLAAPPGRDIRPTADRVRESVFNILEHGKAHARPGGGSRLVGARVLDGFAGTGALGLEALSRGASAVTFMDCDTVACRANIDALDAGTDTGLIRADCLSPPPAAQPCDLILLDPPYGQGMAAPALRALAAAGWIAEDAIGVVELAAKEAFDPPGGFAITEERRYGAARVVLLVYSASSES